jgi:hypothetical protein
MFVWTWVLLVLCLAGMLLALVSIVRLVPLALRLKRRAEALSESRLATSLAGLEIQGRRLSALQGDIEPLTARAGACRDRASRSGRRDQRPARRPALTRFLAARVGRFPLPR